MIALDFAPSILSISFHACLCRQKLRSAPPLRCYREGLLHHTGTLPAPLPDYRITATSVSLLKLCNIGPKVAMNYQSMWHSFSGMVAFKVRPGCSMSPGIIKALPVKKNFILKNHDLALICIPKKLGLFRQFSF